MNVLQTTTPTQTTAPAPTPTQTTATATATAATQATQATASATAARAGLGGTSARRGAILSVPVLLVFLVSLALFVGGILLFGLAFSAPGLEGLVMAGGILGIAAALAIPIEVLPRLDG